MQSIAGSRAGDNAHPDDGSRNILITEIVVGPRRRTINEAKVADLAESLRLEGLINAIVVTKDLTLICGAHRLEAARRIGWETIMASVREVAGADAELLEIDENLIRSELTVLERAEHLHRRDEILRERGLRAPAHRPEENKGETVSPLKTTAEMAGELGLGERSAQQHLQIARDIPQEVRDAIRGHKIASSTSDLLRLARVKDPEQQAEAARRLVDGRALSASNAVAQLRQEERRTVEVAAMSRAPDVRIIVGDALKELWELPDASVQTVVTSPPYWSLRDYGVGGQLGLEPTLEEWVESMASLFREVRRVLREDGTLWLNLGDSYAHAAPCGGESPVGARAGRASDRAKQAAMDFRVPEGCKAKDLIGQAWRLAIALQQDGWYLRSDIIWHKPNPIPESVTDRPTRAHEYMFLLSKSEKYFYDAVAVSEPRQGPPHAPGNRQTVENGGSRIREAQANEVFGSAPTWKRSRIGSPTDNRVAGFEGEARIDNGRRNLRDVWTIPIEPTPGCHFATFPQKLVEPCILAGTSEKGCCASCGAPIQRVVEKSGGTTGEAWHDHKGDLSRGQQKPSDDGTYRRETAGWEPTCACAASTPVPCVVFDPFGGSGTVALVASRLGRSAILIELNPDYAEMARRRVFGNDAMPVPIRTGEEVTANG